LKTLSIDPNKFAAAHIAHDKGDEKWVKWRESREMVGDGAGGEDGGDVESEGKEDGDGSQYTAEVKLVG
jgi:hypothetical protein